MNYWQCNGIYISFLPGMFDRDKSGEITFDEFGALYRYIVDWQNCFKKFDKYGENYIQKESFGTERI